MYHSITIGGKNTWDDWRLVPASRPVFNPPAQKVKTLEIPGGDGVIDLSQSLTGYPVYQNRTGSIEFIVMNDFKPWHMAYSDIMDYLHGQKLRAVLEDDPEYFYEGRFTVNVWKSEKDWSRITIDYDVGPYKWCPVLHGRLAVGPLQLSKWRHPPRRVQGHRGDDGGPGGEAGGAAVRAGPGVPRVPGEQLG